jgi:4-amino-4-deoxy-L-arabinose transferase-like glycosyltransferase
MTTQPANGRSKQTLLLVLLFLTALAASLAEAYFLRQPGTMDACYYYSGGWNFAHGLGWNEFFLWNYLDDFAVLPHPGNMYWMPFPSLIAAAGMFLAGEGFRQAQIPLFLLATGFPFLVFFFGKRLTGSFRVSLLAGFFSIGSGFYAIYWMNTESFLAYAWIGGLIFLLAPRAAGGNRWTYTLLVGILCGLAHMTRADGVLFLAVVGLLIWIEPSLSGSGRLRRLLALGAGYLLASGPWYARNFTAWGSLFPPGTEKAAWLMEYNDLFRFPSSGITIERFLSSGIEAILAARWEALQANFMTVSFVLGLVFLLPLIGWGCYLLRRKPTARTAWWFFLIVFVLMTFVYPFQGSRGGLFHSTAALLSIVCIAASEGLDDVIDRLARWRTWDSTSAKNVLSAGMAVLALATSGVIYASRVVGNDPADPNWSSLNTEYTRGISRLGESTPASTRFMVNNPPCFYVLTGYAAVPVPTGGISMLLEAADRYGVRYVVLDSNVPDSLQSLYQSEISHPRLRKLFSEEYNGMFYLWLEVLPAGRENGA